MVRHYKRVLGEGAVDARTKRGRRFKKLGLETARQFGGNLSGYHEMLLSRALLMREQLMDLDEKLLEGKTWSALDLRTYHALANNYHSLLYRLGKPRKPVEEEKGVLLGKPRKSVEVEEQEEVLSLAELMERHQ